MHCNGVLSPQHSSEGTLQHNEEATHVKVRINSGWKNWDTFANYTFIMDQNWDWTLKPERSMAGERTADMLEQFGNISMVSVDLYKFI